MRTKTLAVLLAIGLLAGCSRYRDEERRSERDPVSRKTGRAAYEVSRETGKLARKAGEALKEATHEAHEGWKEQAARDRVKARERQRDER